MGMEKEKTLRRLAEHAKGMFELIEKKPSDYTLADYETARDRLRSKLGFSTVLGLLDTINGLRSENQKLRLQLDNARKYAEVMRDQVVEEGILPKEECELPWEETPDY